VSEAEKTGSQPAPDSCFEWDARRERAAALLAEGELTDVEIAAEVEVTDRTLRTWKKIPAFAARVKRLVAELGAVAQRKAIGRRARRLAALDDRWQRMKAVIAARADEMKDVPGGGSSGLLVKAVKSIGSGDNAREVEEYAVDAALLREMRELEKQAAQETGQWAEKVEHSGPEGGPVSFIEVRLGKPPDRRDDAGRETRPGVQLPPGPGAGVEV
jgi:hypothetical protein